MKGGVCDPTCQYALSISKKVKRRTLFDAAYNSAFNKLYYYPYDAEMIFDLAMALVNGATKEDVHQMKEAEYIEYTIELTGFDYEDEVEVYHQIAKQINIRLCEECIMPCDEHIPLPIKDDQHEIEFGIQDEEVPVTLIYLTKNQPVITLKYFNNKKQRIKSKKAHEIDAGYDLRYPEKDTLILQPKSLTRINLKIALEIPPGTMVQIASRSFLASKKINIRGGIIDAGYTGDITVMLQNKTNKLFKIEYAEKIAQTIYLPLINISDLQLRGTQDFGSTEQFMVPVNIALNTQNKSYQILRLPQLITISPFGEHHEIYTCGKPTTTQQIFEANEQICMKHDISIPNIYLSKRIKKNYPKQINPKPSSENYHIVVEKLSRINIGQLEPQQQNQLKELITEHADIFTENNNDLRRTDLEISNLGDNKHTELPQKATNLFKKKFKECSTIGSFNHQ
ncbi:hypothetical protein G9A89_015890 [Geosiphon pyriformis]|nr:hypothetical protein G9A89_015890 [Geosiphon pyriformis]